MSWISESPSRLGGRTLAICHVYDGQWNADAPLLPRLPLDCVHKNDVISYNEWITYEVKFLPVESHAIFLRET